MVRIHAFDSVRVRLYAPVRVVQSTQSSETIVGTRRERIVDKLEVVPSSDRRRGAATPTSAILKGFRSAESRNLCKRRRLGLLSEISPYCLDQTSRIFRSNSRVPEFPAPLLITAIVAPWRRFFGAPEFLTALTSWRQRAWRFDAATKRVACHRFWEGSASPPSRVFKFSARITWSTSCFQGKLANMCTRNTRLDENEDVMTARAEIARKKGETYVRAHKRHSTNNETSSDAPLERAQSLPDRVRAWVPALLVGGSANLFFSFSRITKRGQACRFSACSRRQPSS